MPAYKRIKGAAPEVADIAGLMGPLGLPGAAAAVVKKLSADDMALLSDLLGKPIKIGQKLMRLSSGDPQANKVILHGADGSRVNTPMDSFLKLFRSAGEETAEQFPEGAVVSAPGIPAPKVSLGPKGGLGPPKRRLK